MTGEVTLTGWIEIPAPERAAILPLLAEHVRLTREEPGCLAFTVTETADRPDHFAVAERFRDRAAFEAHQVRSADSAWGIATRHLRRHYQVVEQDTG
jgi:quinol monooxygenase YgiN